MDREKLEIHAQQASLNLPPATDIGAWWNVVRPGFTLASNFISLFAPKWKLLFDGFVNAMDKTFPAI